MQDPVLLFRIVFMALLELEFHKTISCKPMRPKDVNKFLARCLLRQTFKSETKAVHRELNAMVEFGSQKTNDMEEKLNVVLDLLIPVEDRDYSVFNRVIENLVKDHSLPFELHSKENVAKHQGIRCACFLIQRDIDECFDLQTGRLKESVPIYITGKRSTVDLVIEMFSRHSRFLVKLANSNVATNAYAIVVNTAHDELNKIPDHQPNIETDNGTAQESN